ncbi:hypothetical protein BRYFOR_06564 [Marvinbryantia formatexigens DSM 14469]|uniref:Uncharacterized protein n=1 Tax=Marvinbryantia formatexigens DSM 14469 TaxID=478749 RepID=C6LDF6_9FIRM|nr:hypothetical protein BRYFOR_06564 [Marvinbryantia formatexigens DSM 14469]
MATKNFTARPSLNSVFFYLIVSDLLFLRHYYFLRYQGCFCTFF